MCWLATTRPHNVQWGCVATSNIIDFADFAPSHPGLSKPVIVEGGRDVTDYFEDIAIRHSKSARAIARRLCLVVDRSFWRKRPHEFVMSDNDACPNPNGENNAAMGMSMGCCGLCRPPSTTSHARKTSRILRHSNTRSS